ncbi:MAG TPA: hypothetical protein VMF08_18315 [Candidatus Sulfotelmatobacter sp.]|nr:hypothetical protein [Candidatus Sulfotelmatobacter sp.]
MAVSRGVNKQAVISYIVFGALIAFSIYRRTRRSIGKQKLRPRRIIVRLVLYGVAIFFIIIAGLLNPLILLGFAGGIAGGVALGLVGLRLTKFETTVEGHFYTPDTRIGVGVSLLLTGRIIYRMAVLNNTNAAVAAGHPPPMGSPLTFFIAGLTFGYYMVYYIGLFVHTHDKTPATASTVPPVLSSLPPPPPSQLTIDQDNTTPA